MASKGKIDEIIDVKAVKSQIEYLKSEIVRFCYFCAIQA